jgi:hypothetical protein
MAAAPATTPGADGWLHRLVGGTLRAEEEDRAAAPSPSRPTS